MVDIDYSGTPLLKKLGFQPPLKVWAVGAPREYKDWLGRLPEGVKLMTKARPPVDVAHVFVTESAFLDAVLSRLRNELKQNGSIWYHGPRNHQRCEQI